MSLFSSLQRRKSTTARIHVDDPLAADKFVQAFCEKLSMISLAPEQPRVLVCIGTDRSTGDSLGPLVGSRLQEVQHTFFKIVGTLDDPVHASNLTTYIDILDRLGNPFIIAVDACLGSTENIGYINIGEGALRPGAGVNKHLPSVGQLHITGIVNVGGFMEYYVLQNTRLNLVMKMARLISEGINEGCKMYARTYPSILSS